MKTSIALLSLVLFAIPAVAAPSDSVTAPSKTGFFRKLFSSHSTPAASPRKRDTGMRYGSVSSAARTPRFRGRPVEFGKAYEKNGVTLIYANAAQRPAEIRHDLLSKAKGNSKLVIELASQRAYLYVDGQVAIDTPVSTARSGCHTPRGTFHISERVRTGKISTIYHVGMPYWMRLSGSEYGVHGSYLPGCPASHGCVRVPNSVVPYVFDGTRGGTKVTIL